MLPPELRPWIDEVETIVGGAGVFVHVPEVAAALAFRTTMAGHSDLIAVGPRSRGSYHRGEHLRVCVRMRLRPGMSRALFGLPISEIVDRAVPVTDLWGRAGTRLADELAAKPDQAMSRLAVALPAIAAVRADARAAAAQANAWNAGSAATARTCIAAAGVHATGAAFLTVARLEPAIRALEAGASTPAAANRLGISERHLRTVFAREVGLSPKHFARIARLRQALSLAGDRGWAQLAGDLGYFDQAHLITEFRTLMGVSPGAFTAGRLPPVSPCGIR